MNTIEFTFTCSHCEQHLKCEVQHAGRQIQCPACQHVINIPNPPAGLGFATDGPETGHTWDTFVMKRR